MKPITSHTCTLGPKEADRLHTHLSQHGFQFREVPYARFAASREKVNVVFYESGKLVIQGKGTQEFIEFVLEPEILKRAGIGYEEVLDPSLMDARIGVDESGKGDFFGPLCIAAVYVNAAVLTAWKGSGIRDSKHIQSDRKIEEFAEQIRSTPGCEVAVVTVGNQAYNRLHTKLGSVNRILAWGHSRAIENLLHWQDRLNPPPLRAISDQFALHKSMLQKALMPLGRQIELVQRHRAEEDLAVGAASILARHAFVAALRTMGKKYDVRFPKGASAAVEECAKDFVAGHGAKELSLVAKTHFRTAARVVS